MAAIAGFSQVFFLTFPIRNKLSLYASCQGDFRRGIKEKLLQASLSIGERCNN